MSELASCIKMKMSLDTVISNKKLLSYLEYTLLPYLMI